MKNIILILLVQFFCSGISAQKSFKKQAATLFKKENYYEALKSLQAYQNIEKDQEALFMKAVCHYHLNEPQACIDEMLKLVKGLYPEYRIFYYLGKSYQDQGMFSDAAFNYKQYLQFTEDKELQASLITEIKRCEYSEKIQYLPQIAYIENFGEAVNTRFDEVAPLQSLNVQNKFYFSSNRDGNAGGQRNKMGEVDDLGGRYAYDMFAIELNDGNYTPVLNFSEEQNTASNEVIQDFNSEGSVMYYLRYTDLGNARILADSFYKSSSSENIENRTEFPASLKEGDRDLKVFNDSIVIFSSKRAGGYGGYDIYFAKKSNEGWNKIINAGPVVNSMYDEVSPFLTKGGNTLIFSSNSLFGLGGFDIFASKLDVEKNVWSERINLGIPINSPKDDVDPFVTHDGTQLLFASDRIGGEGGLDLYIAYLKEQLQDQLNYTEDLAVFTQPTGIAEQEARKEEYLPSTDVNKTKSIVINTPLYFFNDESVLSSNNKIVLNNIKGILDINPEMAVHIIAHSDFDPSVAQALFFNCKRAEAVGEYLSSKGIKSSRITMHSYGNSFPMVNDKGSRNNSRIDLVFYQYNKDRIEINDDLPVLNLDNMNPSYQDYLAGKKALMYKVKLATTKQMMKNDILMGYPYFSVMKNQAGDYEYYCGYKTNYDEAKQLKLSLLAKGFSEAAVVPFVEHTPLSYSGAAAMVINYPDLGQYLEQEK